MLRYYAKDLKSDAAKKADELFKEGVAIAQKIGLTLSDHKLEILIPDPREGYNLKRAFDMHVSDRINDFVTIDTRLCSNNELDERLRGKDTVRLDVYGSKKELLEVMSFIMEQDIECEIVPGPIQTSDPKVPGYIDGESYRKREVIRQEMSRDDEKKFESGLTI